MDEGGNAGRGVEADADVVGRVRRGDVAAYGALVSRYERGVLAAVLAVVRESHTARDVVQDVFVHAYEKLSGLRDGSRFGPWVLTMARREAVRAARKRRRAGATMALTDVAGVEQEWGLGEERERVLRAVAGLPEQERVVVGMRYFDGMSVAEVAAATGRPVGTVTKQLSRAIERLRGGEFRTEMESWRTTKMKSSRTC